MKKQREPIKRFKNVPEMNACMKEWQTLLGLSEWTFYPALDGHLDDNNIAQNNFSTVNKSGRITIRRPVDPNWERCVIKCPDEVALVHELLHAKIIYPDDDFYIDLHFHQSIEDIAKALVAAKYGLPLSWFDTVKDDPSIYPEKKEETK